MLSDNTFRGIGHFRKIHQILVLHFVIGCKSLVKICIAAFVHNGNSTAVQYTSEMSKPFASFSASK